jgi:SAM-dependent methyltransferase
MADLLTRFAPHGTPRALEVGCQFGDLIDALAPRTSFEWSGVDPVITEPMTSKGGASLAPGIAHSLPFPDGAFSAVLLANVYEHIAPKLRRTSLAEIERVLAPGGVLVGQLPNPWFPIESHSRLPFMGWLPYRLQLHYFRLSPVSWPHDFYVIGVRHLRRTARTAGLERVLIRNYNYPLAVIPASVRPLAWLAQPVTRIFPWAWQFVFRKP